MPRFTAIHSVPITEEALITLAKEEAPKFADRNVTWVRTYCSFDDNKFVCEWEGPDKETIEGILNDYEIPFDGIYSARIFDVATAQLED